MDVKESEAVNIVPFSEFIRDYWEKYISKSEISSKTGLVGKNGAVNMGKFQNMYDESQPYMMAYYLVHGDVGLKSASPSYWNAERSEPIFKKALDSGKTWEEVIQYKEPKKGELL